MKKFICLLIISMLFVSLHVSSENKSVASVGNKIILESDIKRKMAGSISYEDALKELILENMLLFKAESEGIEITPEELEAEMQKIRQNFPDGMDFPGYLDSINISYAYFKKMVENRVKTNKLIRQQIVNKIEIRQSEIMNAMKELQSAAENLYSFSLKWFDEKQDAEDFAEGFNEAKEKEMATVDWMKQEEILPEVLNELLNLGENDLSSPFKVKDRYLVLLLKGVRQRKKGDIAELFTQARNAVYQRKFNEQFDLYIKKLQSTIPVLLSE